MTYNHQTVRDFLKLGDNWILMEELNGYFKQPSRVQQNVNLINSSQIPAQPASMQEFFQNYDPNSKQYILPLKPFLTQIITPNL